MVVALAVATLIVARHLDLLKDTLLVLGASILGGLVFLLAHPDMELIHEPREEDLSCGGEELLEPVQEAPRVARVSIEEAKALIGEPGVTFVDARLPGAYEYAHIPGAMSLPAGDAASVLEVQSLPIPPEGQVITYCDGGSCEQSEYLGGLLRERDLCQQVRVLEGGWKAWVAAEGPIVMGEARFADAPTSDPSASPADCEPVAGGDPAPEDPDAAPEAPEAEEDQP